MYGVVSEIAKNGQIGIENGKVIVKDPQGEGSPAVIRPAGEGFTIIVNGELLESPQEVFENDAVEITPLVVVEEEARCILKISRDEFTVEMAVSPRQTIEYKLPDIEMSRELRLTVEKNVITEKTFTLEAAEAKLKEQNVVFGINMDSVKDVLEKASGEPETVATGLKPQEGKDGWVEFLKAVKLEKIDYDENVNTQVNFRERYRYPLVEKGEVVAIVHPPEEGIDGQTVNGKIVSPKAVKSAKVVLDDGVDFLEAKGEIIAGRDGRLSVNGEMIGVSNVISHTGDINMESGNLHFNGDIQIIGNVTEDMLVEAKGDLYVQGNGYGANIRAGAGIQFTQNVIKCDVQGGLRVALLKEVLSLVTPLEKDYQFFLNSLGQIISSLAEKEQAIDKTYFQRIILALMQKMPSSIMELLNGIITILEDNDDQQFDNIKKTAGLMRNMLSGKLELDSMTIPNKLAGNLYTFRKMGEEQTNTIPPLVVSYVQNSNVKHSGEIQIVGAGSYYSSLQSGGTVTVQGVCRGGSIEAQGDVRVKEFVFISTESATDASNVRIKVPAESAIYFDLVHEDVVVQVGKLIHKFENEQSKVKIAYDQETGLLKVVNF